MLISCILHINLTCAALGPYDTVLATSFPLGVYWPWERVNGLAQRNGIEKWAWVERCLDDMKAHHIDAVWVVNLNIHDLRPLADRCEARQMKLVPALSELHYNISWRLNNWEYLEKQSRSAIAAAGDSPAILAWALCDEPPKGIVDEMEIFRRKFREWGAKQPAIVVTTWSDTPHYAEDTNFSVICADIYPFFSAGNPNGPNTPSLSRAHYRRNVLLTTDKAVKNGKTPWVMPQCFCDIWGPWAYTPQGEMRALPGSVIHWRQPTTGEMRWQLWSSLAAGVQGLFIFVYNPPAYDKPNAAPYSGTAFPPSFSIKEDTLIPDATGGIVRPDGSPTPNYDIISRTYEDFSRLRTLLNGAVPVKKALGRVTGSGFLGTLHNPTTGRTFIMVVNDNTDQAQTLDVRLTRHRDVRNLLTNEILKRTGNNTISITLEPGGGAALEYVP